MSQYHSRELTKKEKVAIRKLVISSCANYDREYECLPLEGRCYMCTIGFNTSGLCKYFRNAVLPLDPELESVFTGIETKVCTHCGKSFPLQGRRLYCCGACTDAARRAATARRVQKHRCNKG